LTVDAQLQEKGLDGIYDQNEELEPRRKGLDVNGLGAANLTCRHSAL